MDKKLEFSKNLLSWYDKNARSMPWRLPPNSDETPNPYFIWLSEIMLQQTTVVTVFSYFKKFDTLFFKIVRYLITVQSFARTLYTFKYNNWFFRHRPRLNN